MLVITIDAAKEHLKIDDDAEDGYLADLILAGQAVVENEINRSLIGPDGWPDLASLPASVVHAVKLAIGELYLKREGGELELWAISALVGRHTRVSFA